MEMGYMSIGNLVVGVFCEPTETFRAIDAQPARRALLPFLITLVFPAVLLAAYYYSVNISWLQDQLMSGVDAAQRDSLRGLMSRNVMFGMGVVGLVLTVPAINALFALYFFLIAKTKNLPQGYGKWFGFVIWCSLPVMLLLPIGLYNVMTSSGGQMAPEELNAVSLNQLWFHLPATSAWRTYFESISLISIWTMVLMVLGYRAWSKASTQSAAMVVLIPHILVYGTWAGLILLASAS
jgi:hypothetical protein